MKRLTYPYIFILPILFFLLCPIKANAKNQFRYVQPGTLNRQEPTESNSQKVGTSTYSQAVRKEPLKFIIGIGAGAIIPEDRAFTGRSAYSNFLDLHFGKDPWLGFRLGTGESVSFYEPKIKGAKENQFVLTSTMVYIAYKPTKWFNLLAQRAGIFDETNMYLLLGAARIQSTLKNEVYEYESKDSGIGSLVGGGLSTNIEFIRVGLEYLYFSRKGKFEQLDKIYTGSNQLLLTMAIQF